MSKSRRWVRRSFLVVACCLFQPLPALAATDPVVELNFGDPWEAAVPGYGLLGYPVEIENHGQSALDATLEVNSTDGPSETYRTSVHVAPAPPGRTTMLLYLRGIPGHYRARLVGPGGRLIAQAAVPAANGKTSVGVLAPSTANLTRLSGIASPAVDVTRFGADFPVPQLGVQMLGLNALVVAGADLAALSQAQQQAIHDYVGDGGGLLLTGGNAWRQSLLPLSHDLLPVEPSETDSSNLRPLASLASLTDAGQVTVVRGRLAPGAQVLLADESGQPLAVQMGVGLGRVVLLTFDPSAEQLAPGLATAAWSLGLDRVLNLASDQGPAGPRLLYGSSPDTGNWAQGSPSALDSGRNRLAGMLVRTPAAPLPPIDGLGYILLAYVALLGLGLLLFRRPGGGRWFWAGAAIVSVLSSSGLYALGSSWRDRDYFDKQISIVEAAGNGRYLETDYHSLFAGHTGQHLFTPPAHSLASYFDYADARLERPPTDLALGAPAAQLYFETEEVWQPRTALSVEDRRQGPSLRNQLTIGPDIITGEIANIGTEPVGPLWLVFAGNVVRLGGTVAPGTSVSVAVPYRTTSHPLDNTLLDGSDVDPSERMAWGVGELATGSSNSVLVAEMAPSATANIDGHLARSDRYAFFAQPASLSDGNSTLDFLPSLLVAQPQSFQSYLSTYDFNLPAQVTGRLSLLLGARAAQQVADIYDWSSQSWKPLGNDRHLSLMPGETLGGHIRVRVVEPRPGGSDIDLVVEGN